MQPAGGEDARGGASIHYLPLAFKSLDREALNIRARIENYPQIRRAYGEDIARIVLREIHRRLALPLCRGGVVVPEEDGSVDLLISDTKLSDDCLAGGFLPPWLEAACREITLDPVATSHGPVHVWLSAEFSDPASPSSNAPAQRTAVNIGYSGDPLEADAAWRARYRSDMAKASLLLRAMELGEFAGGGYFGLAWQPVRDAQAPADVLYHEALARRIDGNGAGHSLFDEIQALERIGFIRILDRFVTLRVLDEVDSSTGDASLALNISARSAVCDTFWEGIFARLRGRPDSAHRLVVEITETSTLPDVASAVRFVERLRSLGCRVAIDDFGVGDTSVRTLLALAPDIVKIDKLFLDWASTSEARRETLHCLVALIASLDAVPIVEGVESFDSAQVAAAAGSRWQQGYHWGAPTFCRPWLGTGFGADHGSSVMLPGGQA